MSEFLKPQTPIKYKKDGAYIYPLTTADQVILEDNNRLNFALENLVYFSEELQESAVVPLDADTLEGYTVNSLIDKIYPVGSIYMSVNAVSPATLFGGTWEALKDRFLLGAGEYTTAGSTGGEVTHNHEYGLKVYEYYSMAAFTPKGTATGVINIDDGSLGSWTGGSNMVAEETFNAGITTTTTTASPHHYESRANTSTENNIPPFLSVYMWKRTA